MKGLFTSGVPNGTISTHYVNGLGVVPMSEALPAFLTVEEAGVLLRIGRTKAYAMTVEWRSTGGKSGLPVVDLGDILRVPRKALEELAGGELDAGLLRPVA